MKYPPVHYQEYLMLDQILSSQVKQSEKFEKDCHDETLFIIVHQIYELWFKQILTELNSVILIMDRAEVADQEMGTAVQRLRRISQILHLMNQQISIMETMTPMDFLEFRDMLFPASGFQSFQFRQLEILLGLPAKNRLLYNSATYEKSLTPEQAKLSLDLEKGPNLLKAVEKWLERTPFLNVSDFTFWDSYKTSVLEFFENDKEIIKGLKHLSPEDQKKVLTQIEGTQNGFSKLFDEESYEKQIEAGEWNLSYRAIHAALFIQLYREQPALQLPFSVLNEMIEIDEALTAWRYRHSLMAKRMLGSKVGTGGSSGAKYLRESTEKHRIFSDLIQLTTFLIPRSALPPLPDQVKTFLGFAYSKENLSL